MVSLFVALELGFAFHASDWSFVDEPTYIQASERILYDQPCNLSGISSSVCNYEHTPLSKVLSALSLAFFGRVVPTSEVSNLTNGAVLPALSSSIDWFLAFRFFQILLGSLSIPLLYFIALKLSANKSLALGAAALLFLEPLYLFFSRTAFLDIPMMFFVLCSYAVYLGPVRLGRLDEYSLAGIFLGLSILSKEEGVMFVFPLVLYHFCFRSREATVKLREIGAMVASTALVFAGGLQAFDTLGHTPFPTFANNVAYMVAFSNAISCHTICNLQSTPWSWFFFFSQAYWYDGLSINLSLLWLALVWIPWGLYRLFRCRNVRMNREDRLLAFAALLFGTAFAANCVIYLYRGVYAWYYLTLVPSLALGAAYLITSHRIPAVVRLGMVGLLIGGYIWAYYLGPSLLAYD